MLIPVRHLGDTRSEKLVQLWDTIDLAYIRSQVYDFSIPDHFDAFCIFEFKALQALRLYGKNSDEEQKMLMMSSFHRDSISDEQFAGELSSLGLMTSIDIRNYGESLVKHFLR